jgi:two-component system, OmpR family, KDP operon response regulator KdpE
MSTKTIMVVDDDPLMQRLIGANLKASGYKVLIASDGKMALSLMEEKMPDLVLLDIMMPGIDGKEICRRIREWSQVPIIMITAKTAMSDKVALLDMGANDYITKPFGVEELLARIRVVFRHTTESNVSEAPFFVSNDLRIDFINRSITVGGKHVDLTPIEYDILSRLAFNANKVMTHRELMALVWGGQTFDRTDYLRTYIRRLRRKIESDPANPRHIRTKTRVGYYLQSNETE